MNRFGIRVGKKVYRVGGDGTVGTIVEVSPDGYGVLNIRVQWDDTTIELVARKHLRLTPPGTKPGSWSSKGYLG